MRYAVFGMGGFGREVAPLVGEPRVGEDRSQLAAEKDVVFVDDNAGEGAVCNGLPVIGFDALASDDHRDRSIIVAIGDGRTREKIERRCLEAKLKIGSLTAPTARVLACNEIGPGAVLCDGVIVTSNARIGRSFQANICSYVAHDCVIGDYVTFAPRVSCNGTVVIGDYAYIGTGAMFIQGKEGRPMTVGEGALVGMGAVVTKPVEPYTVVAGNPARPIRRLPRPDR